MANPRDCVSVERLIQASPAAIFEVLAAPGRHPEFDGSGTVVKAQADSPVRLSQGAVFGMDMRQGMRYRMVNTVTEFEEGRRIAWSPRTSGLGARFGGRIWRYELEPVDGGTLVRETWDISEEGLRLLLRPLASSRTRKNMAKSLDRLADLVAGAP
jgi:uncharacterized protein YndB with AHSA1/START domain